MNTIRIVKGSNNRTWDGLLTDKSVKIDFFFCLRASKTRESNFCVVHLINISFVFLRKDQLFDFFFFLSNEEKQSYQSQLYSSIQTVTVV